jgi:hypothetical protein
MELILILASATGAIKIFGEMIASSLADEKLADILIKTITNAFFHFDLKVGKEIQQEQHQHEAVTTQDTANGLTLHQCMSDIEVDTLHNQFGDGKINNEWRSFSIQTSTNVAILFVGNALIATKSKLENELSTGFQLSPSSFPIHANMRRTNIHRIFNSHNVKNKKDVGILGTLCGVETEKAIASLTNIKFVSWPYIMNSCSKTRNWFPVKNVIRESSYDMGLNEPEVLEVREMDVSHLRSLVDLVSNVSSNVQCELYMVYCCNYSICNDVHSMLWNLQHPDTSSLHIINYLDGKGVNDYGSRCCYLLYSAIWLLNKNFNGLKSFCDWRMLYEHLTKQASWTSLVTTPYHSTQGEIVRWCILLFQSLCPIRFAILDGLARMISIGYYLHAMFPGDNMVEDCVMPLSKVVSEITQGWTPETTALQASFDIMMPTNKMTGGSEAFQQVQQLKEDLFTISYTQYSNVTTYEPFHFSDRILSLMSRLATLEFQKQPSFWGVVDYHFDYFKVIIQHICKFIFSISDFTSLKTHHQQGPGTQSEQVEAIISRIHGESKQAIIPVFMNTSVKVHERKFFVLTYVLGALCSNEEARQNVEELIARDWRGRVSTKIKPYGLEWSSFHRGTYLDEGKDNHPGNILYKVSHG